MAMWGLDLVLLYSPLYPLERSLAIAKSILAAIDGYESSRFEPEFDDDRATLEAERDPAFETSFKQINLLHPSKSDGVPWRLSFLQAWDEKLNWASFSLTAALAPDDHRGVDKAWRFLRQAAPQIIAIAPARFAIINGTGESGLKARGLAPDALPPVMTPWTWIGPQLLNAERRAALNALPDCTITPLAEGIAVQCVPDFNTKPTPALLAAIRSLPTTKKIQYRQSTPPG